MKLGLMAGALVCALGATACGGSNIGNGGCSSEDGCAPGPVVGAGGSGGWGGSASGSGSSSGGGSVRADAGMSGEGGADASADPDADADAAASADPDAGTGSASSSGSSSGSSGPAICAPGNACDECYSSECCSLSCDCSDPSGTSGTLECSMVCTH
jgi:hypothetical protein